MRYMIMMFGEAGTMMETAPTEWIREMIGFMIKIDQDLTESGELVFQAGLADGSTAKLVSLENGVPVVTEGSYAESKDSLIGYWVLDVEDEARIIEIAAEIASYANKVEVRQVADGPPEV